MPTYLPPSRILFTKNSISSSFRDRSSLVDTFRQLAERRIDATDIEPVHVVKWKDKWKVVSGNRRLFLYKRLEREKIVEDIPVIVKPLVPHVFKRKNTTTNEGRSIACDDDRFSEELSCRLDEILEECRTATTKTTGSDVRIPISPTKSFLEDDVLLATPSSASSYSTGAGDGKTLQYPPASCRRCLLVINCIFVFLILIGFLVYLIQRS